jgi:DNA-binding response OmpR family regulator
MSEDTRKPLGRILLQNRAISQPDLDRALQDAPSADRVPLATRLTESGAISEVAALKALSEQSGVPGIDLNQVCIRLSDIAVLPREIALRHKLLPVLARDDRIFVAMATPDDKKVIDELEFVTGKRVFPYVALAGPLGRVIAVAYEMRERGEAYYVGPRCPPEILAKAGITVGRPTASPPADEFGSRPRALGAVPVPPAPASESEVAELSFRPANLATKGFGASPVVVDDQMNAAAAADELTESDFGRTEASVVAPLPPGTAIPPSNGRRTVLVVDDEPDIRRLLRRAFEERGYRVIEADRGLVALRLVKEHTPDVMVLDAMLPEVHGFDIARRMKGTKRYGHIPIVMVSAVYRGWRIAEDLKSSYGVEAYIEKPFRVADVLAAAERALERRAAVGAAPRISSEAEKLLAAGIAAYQAGDVTGAIEQLRQGTRVDPLAGRLHFHLGLLYGKQGNLYDAIQELETALDLDRRHFPALKNLAVLYQKAGFRNKAIETWERALAAAPDDGTRQSIKEHLLGLL